MTTDKKTQETPDVKKQKVARQQVTKPKQVMKSHEKPIAHKAPTNNTNRPTVMKQQVENAQVTKKISVQDLFAIPPVSQMNSKPQQIPHTKQQRAMSNNLPIQQNTPSMHKTRSYTYGSSMQSHQLHMTNTPSAKTRGASPPTGAYANPAYSDSPSAREVPMPPLNWLFDGMTTTTTTTKPLTGTDFLRAFAVAPVN
jgi:hypothetical protein